MFSFQIRPEPRQRPRRPGSTHADQLGKRKAADLVGRSAALLKSQTLAGKSQSRSGESCKSRRKVAKSLGIVVSHSRKSRESRSVLRVIVAGCTHHIFEVLLLQVLGGNLISELLVGCQHDLLLVRIAHVVLH